MRVNGPTVVAILTSDWHLSEKAPLARSAESDWLAAQARPLHEVKLLQERYGCPVVIAGDVFDKHDPGPALLNWAIAHMPNECIGIPGQHDLRHHRLASLRQTAYWTLVEANKLADLAPKESWSTGPLDLYPFPWGVEPVPCPDPPRDLSVRLAVCHRYIWRKGHGYEGAPNDSHWNRLQDRFAGYDVVASGDNHQGFLFASRDTSQYPHLFNAGTLMRRKRDERDYKPMVGLLHSDGSVVPYHLDCSEDLWLEDEGVLDALPGLGADSFVEALKDLKDAFVDFGDRLNRLCERRKVDPAVRALALSWLEKKR